MRKFFLLLFFCFFLIGCSSESSGQDEKTEPGQAETGASPGNVSTETPQATEESTPTINTEPIIIRLDYEPLSADFFSPEWILFHQDLISIPFTTPEFEGNHQFFGEFSFYRKKFPVVLDFIAENSAWAYFDTNFNYDLSDEAPYLFTSSPYGELSVEFQVPYPNSPHPYLINFSWTDELSSESDTFYLNYSRASYQLGQFLVNGRLYDIAMIDENVDGLFDNKKEDLLWVDFNQNNKLTWMEDNERLIPFDQPIRIDDECYLVEVVSPDGSTIEISPQSLTTVSVNVTSLSSGEPVPDVRVRLGPLESKTNSTGLAVIDACPGKYESLLASEYNYIPERISSLYITSGDEFNMQIAPISEYPSGEVTLGYNDSYDFLRDLIVLQNGDMRAKVSRGGASFFYPETGIYDLGNLGNIDLNLVEVPTGEMEDYQIPIVEGHVYVLIPEDGKEGHYIVFNVLEVNTSNNTVTIEYVFK